MVGGGNNADIMAWRWQSQRASVAAAVATIATPAGGEQINQHHMAMAVEKCQSAEAVAEGVWHIPKHDQLGNLHSGQPNMC
jgi:hypothetical protein